MWKLSVRVAGRFGGLYEKSFFELILLAGLSLYLSLLLFRLFICLCYILSHGGRICVIIIENNVFLTELLVQS